jgi:hypothetical protein
VLDNNLRLIVANKVPVLQTLNLCEVSFCRHLRLLNILLLVCINVLLLNLLNLIYVSVCRHSFHARCLVSERALSITREVANLLTLFVNLGVSSILLNDDASIVRRVSQS